MYKIIFFFVCILSFACKPKVVSHEKSENVVSNPLVLPGIPESEILRLYNEVDYIDYIWSNPSFSMSIDKKEDIQQSVVLIANESIGSIPANCKPNGRKFFTSKGVTLYEADFYLADGCQFYLIYKDGKPAFANKITTAGLNFYADILNQIKKGK